MKNIKIGWQGLWLALQFLTRLPSVNFKTLHSEAIAISTFFLPVIGALNGLIIMLLAYGISFSDWNFSIQALLLLGGWLWLTGALHWDGVADCADAWLGSNGNHGRALKILKDFSLGTAAGVVLIIGLVLQWQALILVLEKELWLWLPLVLMLGQWSAVVLMMSASYVRDTGQVTDRIHPSHKPWLALWLWVLAMLAWSLNPLFMAVSATVFIAMWWFSRRLTGGMTGDTAGATIVAIETALLLALVY